MLSFHRRQISLLALIHRKNMQSPLSGFSMYGPLSSWTKYDIFNNSVNSFQESALAFTPLMPTAFLVFAWVSYHKPLTTLMKILPYLEFMGTCIYLVYYSYTYKKCVHVRFVIFCFILFSFEV